MFQVTGKIYLFFEDCVCATKEKPLKSSGRITQKEYTMGLDTLDKDHSGFFTRSEVVLEKRGRVLFIGTRFRNLYTAVDTPAEAA